MSMGESKTRATRFVNQISEAIGMARAELMDYQSTYKNILSGLGDFTDLESEKISESLTKMALDYSSLFNVGQSESMNKFQSALVGSIRPIRSDSGYDVSDLTIGAKAQELGIERSVNQLNQMEKRLLRIIVLMEQLRNTGAMGDLARTIESPSNQLKVLQSQLQEVGVWIGNVFIGTLGKALPYINGFVMVIKELIKMLAIFTGYEGDSSELKDVFEGVENSTTGISSSIGDANKKAKELRKTLMSFDVLNVIATPSENDSSPSGVGGVGSIDPAILDALGEYDSLMEKVRMKATDIRDKIMDWLGFTKIIDPLTREITWKLNDGYTNLEKILDLIKAIGVGVATWKLSSSFMKLFSQITGFDKKLSMRIATGLTLALTGTFIQYNGISHLIDDGADIFTVLETIAGTAGIGTGIYAIIDAITKSKNLNISTGKKIGIAFGLTLAITGINLGMKAIQTGNLKYMILSSIMTGAGIGLSLTMLGVTPTISIGIAVAISIISFLIEWSASKSKELSRISEEIKNLKTDIEDTINSYDNMINDTKLTAESQLLDLEYAEKMKDKLDSIVDANGRIQDGYEERADFILGELNNALGTEYERNGQIIQGYQDMETEIGNIIAQKKKEIELEAYSEMYKESIKQQIELEKKQQELQKKKIELNKEAQKINPYTSFNIVGMYQYNKALDEINEATEKNNQALEDATTSISFYGEQVDKLAMETSTASEEIITNTSEMITTTTEEMKKLANTNEVEFISRLNNMNAATQASILAQSTTIDNYSGEIEAKWQDMATNSKDSFANAIALVDDSVEGTILASITSTQGLTPDMVQAWINLGSQSNTEFENAIKNIDTYTASKIIASKTQVEGLTESNTLAWKYLAEQADGSYENGIANIDNYTKEQIDGAINEISTASPNLSETSASAGTSANSSFQAGLGEGDSLVNNFIDSMKNAFISATFAGSPILAAAIKLGNAITDAFQKNTNLSATASISGGGDTIGARAGGGSVNMGEMFIAREAGPELVGKIGKTTSVINNQQIIQGVSQGVATAVTRVLGNMSSRKQQYVFNNYIGTKQIQSDVHELNERENNIRGR